MPRTKAGGESETEIDDLLSPATSLDNTAHESTNNDTEIKEQYVTESKSTSRKLGRYFNFGHESTYSTISLTFQKLFLYLG